MRNLITKYFYLPLFDRIKKTEVRKFLTLFKDSLSWSEEKIHDYQNQKLKELLIHAYNNVPFYKNRFDEAGINIHCINLPDDYNKIPPLTRTDIQNNFESLTSRKHLTSDFYRGSSSGSTGEPVHYYHDNSASSSGRAAVYFGWMLSGWQFGQKGLHIWGNPNAVNQQWKKISSHLKSFMLNVQKFPAYKLHEDENLEKIIHLLITKNFDYIDGYTNAIFLIAKFVQDNNIKLKKVKSVHTTGENLHDYQRSVIEKFLGPVYDAYGCGEIMGIAYQTNLDKYYTILDTNVYVEYDSPISIHEKSRPLIITHLHNYGMPLIRYKNGDLAEPSDNKSLMCNFSSLKNISGRVSDIITLNNGGHLVIPSFFGSKLLRLVDCIKQYQVIKTNNGLTIKLLPSRTITDHDKKIINDNLKIYLNNKIEYSIVYGPIKADKNGKFKLVVDESTESRSKI